MLDFQITKTYLDNFDGAHVQADTPMSFQEWWLFLYHFNLHIFICIESNTVNTLETYPEELLCTSTRLQISTHGTISKTLLVHCTIKNRMHKNT